MLRQIAGVSGISGRAEAKPIWARRSPSRKQRRSVMKSGHGVEP